MYAFVFISLCLHFWLLQCIFIVKLSMSFLRKKIYSLLSVNPQLTHSFVRSFWNFAIMSSAKRFKGSCHIVWTSCSCRLPFRLAFDNLSKKCDNLSPVFSCSYDSEPTVYYSSPGHLNISHIHLPLHMFTSTSCYLRLKKRILSREFSKNPTILL